MEEKDQIVLYQQDLRNKMQPFTRRLLNIINKKKFGEVSVINNFFTLQEGGIAYRELMKLPVESRLPMLVEAYGIRKIHSVVTILLSNFCNSYNVIRPMNEAQVVACAKSIIDTSTADYFAIEDLIIFFERAKRAEFGRVLDRLDEGVIFEMFAKYREARSREYERHVYEKSVVEKSMGDSGRSSDDNTGERNAMKEAMGAYLKMKK